MIVVETCHLQLFDKVNLTTGAMVSSSSKVLKVVCCP